MVSFQNEWVTRFLSLSTMQHFLQYVMLLILGAAFKKCIQMAPHHDAIESSFYRLKCVRERFFFLLLFVFSPIVLREYLSVMNWLLDGALNIYKRQTINNRINTWTIPWWSAVVKISNKENQTIHQKCICGRQFFFSSPFIFDLSHSRNISAEMQCFVFGMGIYFV